ncbi:hypothetical protein GCM10009661_83110 [Catellatospora chokoriensis]|uniref:Uncharacterized protein n=1 Tax=Catellatospora chokoriensis TaxID=310353 RepID=A0A8J3NW29_9ACTN|nr:hypothetical protein C8E86_5706 [Catellatospora citrea]GIF94543.1 hypothetical protein Cch02nite_79870 [Catellatospora chokoriensis]
MAAATGVLPVTGGPDVVSLLIAGFTLVLLGLGSRWWAGR